MIRKKLLIVDDQHINLQVMETYLADEGFIIVKTRKGEEVVELARKERPDAIIMDLLMPGMRGDEVTRLLKSDPALSRIPVILVTADILAEADDLDTDFFLRRPVKADELLSIVKKAMGS